MTLQSIINIFITQFDSNHKFIKKHYLHKKFLHYLFTWEESLSRLYLPQISHALNRVAQSCVPDFGIAPNCATCFSCQNFSSKQGYIDFEGKNFNEKIEKIKELNEIRIILSVNIKIF